MNNMVCINCESSYDVDGYMGLCSICLVAEAQNETVESRTTKHSTSYSMSSSNSLKADSMTCQTSRTTQRVPA